MIANRTMSSVTAGDRILLVDVAVRGRDCGCDCNAGVEGADIEVRDGEDVGDGEEEGVDRTGGQEDIITVGKSCGSDGPYFLAICPFISQATILRTFKAVVNL